MLDDAAGLLHDDRVGDDGHHVPARRGLHGHVAEYVLLLLVAEAGSPPFPLLQRAPEGVDIFAAVALEVDDVEEVLEGAVAVGVQGADQDVPRRVHHVGKALVVVKGEGKPLGDLGEGLGLLDQPRDAVGKGEVLVDAQSPDPRVIVKKGLPDTAALQGAKDLEAVFA